jgi:DNA-binding transcriptional ArsR family regulator
MLGDKASSHSRAQMAKSPKRPPEVDKYVDTFLSTVCDTSRRYILELLALPNDQTANIVSTAKISISPTITTTTLPEWRSGDIARKIGLSAATTSEHLRMLADQGLITSRREGNVVYYSLRNHKLVQSFQDLLTALDKDYELLANS